MRGSEWDDSPVLITEAAPSNDDQQAARKRKYIIMMMMRIPCLVLAAIFIQVWWLAVVFVLLSIPLPWIAVLIANDRPPRKSEDAHWYRHTPNIRALERTEHPVIDS